MNSGTGAGRWAASSLLARKDPSGADSRNRNDHQAYQEPQERLQSGQISPVFPLIYTVNIGTESLVRDGQYRDTADGTDGEIQRYLSVKISKETSGSNRPRPFSCSKQIAMCASPVKYKLIPGYAVDQQPVTLNMALLMVYPIPGKRMILIYRRERGRDH